MSVDWELVIEAIKALAWPLVVVFSLYLFRHPLVDLVAQIARRAQKVSVFEVSVEFATLPELHPSWSVKEGDVRRLTSSSIFDSSTASLFHDLLKATDAECAIVDLGSGQGWLTSRLFIFALILGEVRGLRAFVFVETVAGIRQRFLGIATPYNVRRSLGVRYPWLEEAFAKALLRGYTNGLPLVTKIGSSTFTNAPSPLMPGAEEFRVMNFVRSLVEELQRKSIPPNDEQNSYISFETAEPAPGMLWERTHWISGDRLERDLAGVLDYAWLEVSPDTPRTMMADAVVRRPVPLVALVDADRKFRGLVDRYALLDLRARP
jgi:hypothetical protein